MTTEKPAPPPYREIACQIIEARQKAEAGLEESVPCGLINLDELSMQMTTALNAAHAAGRREALDLVAKHCDESAAANEKLHDDLATVASNPHDAGVLKFLARSGEAQRIAGFCRALAERGR